MKLCGTCKGEGSINFEICRACDGEGVYNRGTFTVGKVQRRRSAEFEVEQKKIKFDKKNANRSV
ncbi:hypothetical protein [Paenibacillus agilis]|uniref:Molecular chaperone DnaJ n=1 Tax=Paenibacillus agilis TaxID=3020863 RepID=A0A559IEB4_9BACL|nr:hypothetical protein [Paenibacillus agilis]TVX85986.1 hypothetical protein FPZ44_23850 [Paenibacillus agilis]